LKFNDDFFWSTYVQAVAFRTTDAGYKLDETPYAIFDSGTPYIFVPPMIFNDLLDELLKDAGYP
jgi:hypothetical protein